MTEPGEPTAAPALLVDHFFRTEAGRLTAHLTRRFGARHLELCEDAVQSALEKALLTWPRRGIPERPSAWLTTAAKNFVLDRLRREAHLDFDGDESASDASVPPETIGFEREIEDDTLRMLLVCCDEELPVQTRLVLSLKLVCGFSPAEIATRLFSTEVATRKTLTRGRERLKELLSQADEQRSAPDAAAASRRLASAQHVIYLLFNEGYGSQKPDQIVRQDLCDEALRLGQLLVQNSSTRTSSSWALLSLLHFLSARLGTRLDQDGHLLLLEEQDRSQWDETHIREGARCFVLSTAGDTFSRYHGEAAIQQEHCLAPSFAATRWHEIVELYELLEALSPSPLYTLNRAIALAQVRGPAAGLELLRAQVPPTWLEGYYLWGATLGELSRQSGDFLGAERYLEQAVELAPTHAEKQLFRRRLEQCRAHDSQRARMG